MKEKITTILLLFFLLAPMVATVTVFHYQKRRIRKELKRDIIAGIDKDELVVLKFTEEESRNKLQWKHSKEFEFNGQMYDVVEMDVNGDTTSYWCWWDNEETQLNKHLNELLTSVWRKDAKKNDTQQRLTDFYKSLYCQPIYTRSFMPYQKQKDTISYEFTYNAVSISPPDPPPKCKQA